MAENKNKWLEIFYAGRYEFYGSNGEVITVNFTDEDVKQIAENYDPKVFEANLHIGHYFGEPEQRALAWIGALKAEGGKLFSSFSHISEEAMKLSNDKAYKKVSVELDRIEGKPGKYLVGLGFTNYPKVTDLPPFQFSQSEKLEMKERGVFIIDALNFSNSNNLTENKMNISENVLKFAQRIGLSVTEFNSDTAVLDAAAEQIAKLQANFANEPDVVGSLSLYIDRYSKLPGEIETLKNENAALSASNVDSMINAAITEGKILPAEKSVFETFASKISPAEFKDQLSKLPVKQLFKNDVVPTGNETLAGDGSTAGNDPKFKNADGSALTFEQFSKKMASRSKEDKDFVRQFSNEDVKKLPGYKEAK